jgi:hypothetical protein
MPDDSLHQPHDKLFRATLSEPTRAAAFPRNHLGGEARLTGELMEALVWDASLIAGISRQAVERFFRSMLNTTTNATAEGRAPNFIGLTGKFCRSTKSR